MLGNVFFSLVLLVNNHGLIDEYVLETNATLEDCISAASLWAEAVNDNHVNKMFSLSCEKTTIKK